MTQRIPAISPDEADGKVKDLFDTLTAQIGGIPNIFRTLAQSPAVLGGFLAFNGALGEGALDAKLREQIALTVARRSRCDYCASAHALLAKKAGATNEEVALAMAGKAADARSETALSFVSAMVEKGGQIAEDEIDNLRRAEFTDEEIVEVVAIVGVNLFTNYFNHVAGTEVDFPLVKTAGVSAAA